MGGRLALALALLFGAAGLPACGGGGGDPGECRGSLEVCSEGREDAAVVVTTTTSGIGSFSPASNPAPPPAGETGAPVIPVTAGTGD